MCQVLGRSLGESALFSPVAGGQGKSGPAAKVEATPEEPLHLECTKWCACVPGMPEDSGHGCQIALQSFLNFK